MLGDVLLIHGLAESALSMSALSIGLSVQGFKPHNFTFPSTKLPIENLTDAYLRPAIEELDNKPVIHLVAHSMGAIMVRQFLKDHKIKNLGRIVLLAPGNSGSPPLNLYSFHPLFKFLGPAGEQSKAGKDCFACQLPDHINEETGVIAGYCAYDPLSYLTMPWPHDSKTTVKGTKLQGIKDHIVLPTGHDTMLFDFSTIYQTSHFLKHGRFLH